MRESRVHPRARWAWFRPALLALAVLLLAPLLIDVTLGLQDPSADPPAATQLRDPRDDRVPRGAVRAYLDLCRAGRYGEAGRFLHIRTEGPQEDAATLARHLKVVLDQKLWVDLNGLSDRPEGHDDDGLPPDQDRLGTIGSARGDLDLLLERIDAEGGPVWRFASSTVAAVPQLYDEFGYGPLGAYLPDEFFVLRFLEIQLWQWIGLVLLVFVAYAAGWLAAQISYRALRRLVARTDTAIDDRILDACLRPMYVIFAVVFFHLGAVPLRLSLPVQEAMRGLEKGLVIVGVIWVSARLIDVFAVFVRQRFEEDERKAAVAIIPMGQKGAKVALAVLGGIALLQNLGFNVTGIIAGLGVGGIAVALAAQRSLENLLGGVMLVMDQPVRVGDFCRWGDKVGTVEDVGLRSTRVRTLERTLVAIPNADFSNSQIENFAQRDRIRMHIIMGLRYETTSDQLRHVLVGLRKLLAAHPRVNPDPARVRFIHFGAYSLDVEINAYIETSEWNEFLKIREDIYLRVMEVVRESGTGFAFPSQTTYLARDGGLQKDVARSAEEEVARWREDARLPFPDFAPETLAEIDNTLDYPPRGSESSAPV